MKKYLISIIMLMVIISAGCAPSDATESTAVIVMPQYDSAGMELNSAGVTDGVMDASYGINGHDVSGGVPLLSLPLEITGTPEGTVCYAIYIDDPDSQPVCGYRWVHWMAVNITDAAIPEDFSRQAGDKAVQGRNDFGTIGYGGPTPPDKDHTYEITVYALDSPLPLSEGFTKYDLKKALDGHVLASVTLSAIYKK